MDDVYLRLMSLPHTVHGITVQDEDGDYNIYINARLTHEKQQEAMQHELKHIESNDFTCLEHIKQIER